MPIALRMDTNGVPYYHGIPIANTNMQAVLFTVMAAANKRFYIQSDDNTSTNKTTWRQQYLLTRRMWKAGMP